MKRSEIIEAHAEAIIAEMCECYRDVVSSDGRVQYKLYIWDDGEIERLYGVQGDTSYLRPRSCEPRKLYYVDTIAEEAGFSVWDFSEYGKPDSDDERDSMRDEIIDWLCDGFFDGVRDRLDAIIYDAQQDERFDADSTE